MADGADWDAWYSLTPTARLHSFRHISSDHPGPPGESLRARTKEQTVQTPPLPPRSLESSWAWPGSETIRSASRLIPSSCSAFFIEGFPAGASGKESPCQYRRCKRARFDPWVGKSLWRRIPWSEEPSGLQSTATQRVGPDRASPYMCTCFSSHRTISEPDAL